MESIENLLEVNNQFYSGLPLSFAMGAATSRPGERLEAVVEARRSPDVRGEARPLRSRCR